MRSSIFLPFKDIKHIVIIDAHDDNYQLHMGLYYDTIDLVLKHFVSARIVFHALLETPYVFEINKKSKKIDKRLTPNVEIISMKDELLQGNTQMISKALGNQIEETLNQKQKDNFYYINDEKYEKLIAKHATVGKPEKNHIINHIQNETNNDILLLHINVSILKSKGVDYYQFISDFANIFKDDTI
jgi:hypothetical protein